MKKKPPRSADALRRRAETLLAQSPESYQPAQLQDVKALAQELAIHQAELELQNEELRETQAALQEAKNRFAALYEQAPAGYVVLDAAGVIRQANATWLSMLHRQEDDLRGSPFADTLVAEDAQAFRARFRAFFRNPLQKRIIVRMKRRDATPFHARIEARPNLAPAGETADDVQAELMVIVTDITELQDARQQIEDQNRELQQAKERTDRLNAILRAIRNVNQLITKEDDVQRLIQGACENLTEELSYHNAWIALFDESRRTVTAAESRFGERFPAMRERLEAGQFPRCVLEALASDRVVVIASVASQCAGCPLCAAYADHAALSRRLAFSGKTYGVLTVAVPAACAAEPEEQSLFDEVAGDLGFALHKIEMVARLAEARRRHVEIFQGSRDGFVMIDPSGRILDANHAFCDMLGYSLDELRQDAPLDPIRADDWPPPQDGCIWPASLGERSALYEKQYRRKDGTIFPVELQAYAVRDAGGTLQYVWATCRDLTERQQREERITILGRMLDAAPAAITIHDETGRFLFANREAVSLHGYHDEAELLAVNLHELDVPDSAALIRERLDRIRSDGEARFEVTHYRKDGSTFPLEVLAKFIKWNGRPAVLSVAADITERKQAQEALRQSEQRLAHLFERAPLGYQSLDADGRFIEVNQAWLDTLGYQREEVIGKWFGDFLAPDYVQAFRERFAIFKANGKTHTEFEMLHRNGQRRLIAFEGRIGHKKDGSFDKTHCILQDITERKALEDQLRQSQKMEAVGRLAAGIAHDINNQLTVVRGYSDLLLDQRKADDPLYAPLDEIRNAARRAHSTTSHLLSFSRRQILNPQPMDLNVFLREIRGPAGKMIGEDVRLVLSEGPDLPLVQVDRAALHQALMNLIVNARDAMPQGGVLTLRTSSRSLRPPEAGAAERDYVVMEVVDTGVGMDPGVMERIFDPFFTTKEVGKGTGLGLPMVQGFVRQSGGFVEVRSAPGQGSTFSIFLPASCQSSLRDDDRPAVAAPSRGSGNVLVVEDEEAVRALVVHALRQAGYCVHSAADPAEALRLVGGLTHRLDLLISDVVMPGMNGAELAEQIRRRVGPVPTLFMTGYMNDEIRRDLSNYLLKPFAVEELIRRVRQTLQRGSPT